MSRNNNRQQRKSAHRQLPQRIGGSTRARRMSRRPMAAFRHRSPQPDAIREPFNAPEDWHEPEENGRLQIVVQKPGSGYVHVATPQEVRDRIAQLPKKFTRELEVVQFSRMTKKRALFPCYGMQWGSTVYLYPIEDSFVETYVRPPRPEQMIEAKMYGGKWIQDGNDWKLEWTAQSIKDFYLNNVLIHEIGHIYDDRNSNTEDRERYANWFAIEYGYRASRGRR